MCQRWPSISPLVVAPRRASQDKATVESISFDGDAANMFQSYVSGEELMCQLYMLDHHHHDHHHHQLTLPAQASQMRG
jgi:hypothetical protein